MKHKISLLSNAPSARLLAKLLPAILACLGTSGLVRAEGSESSWVKLREGAKLSIAQEGEPGRPLALAAADFDEDGVPDLIASYAGAQGGRVVLRRGNVDAIYPNSPEAKLRKEQGQFTEAAFLAETGSFAFPEAPDFLGAGDFDADGHGDIVAACAGSDKLYWLRGDGHGSFSAFEQIELHGVVTALITGEMNRVDGLTDVGVGIVGNDGPRALVFECPGGALRGAPESFELSAPASAVAFGQLDDDRTPDLVVGSGNEVVIVHGRDRKLSLAADVRAGVRPAQVTRTTLASVVKGMAVGDFTGDSASELAVFLDDGSVRLLQRGKGSGKSASEWRIDEAMNLPASVNVRRLIATKVSSLPKDDLILFGGTNEMQIVTTTEPNIFDDSGKVTKVGSARMSVAASLPVPSEVITVLPMRLNVDALRDLVLLRKESAAPSVLISQPAAIYVVNATGNSSDVAPGDGDCLDAVGNCTFSAAIQEANAHAGADTIEFNISGAGPHIVSPNFAQVFSDVTTIDGTTQPGSRVEVIGNGILPFEFTANGGNSVVRGVAAYSFGQNAITIRTAGNLIEGNYIGLRADGSAPAGDRTNGGIAFFGGGNTLIGGTTAQARNVISNCTSGVYLQGASGNTIRGNYIGTNVAGTAALPNTGIAIRDTQAIGLTLGGSEPGAGNLISGNGNNEGRGTISIENSSATLVQGNFIGTTADGMEPLSNAGIGISLGGPEGPVTIGGTNPAARNVIAASATGFYTPQDSAGADTLVQGNFIGTNSAGTGALPNLSHGIELRGPLHITVGGTAAGAGNLISGNGADGIYIGGGINSVPTRAVVQGNLIGTDLNGVVAIGNLGNGISMPVSTGSLIGGTSAEARNIISGNRANGIQVHGFAASDPNRVEGNYIGLNIFGTGALGNINHGVYVTANHNGHTIGGSALGAGNRIAFNGGDGIASEFGYLACQVLSNSIYSNTGLGIDRGNNGVTPFQSNEYGQKPVLTAVDSTDAETVITGKLRTRTDGGNLPHTIQFFSSSSSDQSGYGEGKTFVGETTISAGSNTDVPFTATITPAIPPGRFVSAVAVGPGETINPSVIYSSEFSFCARVAGDPTPKNTPLLLHVATPNTGGDTGLVTITITGEGMREGATFLLRRAGHADIIGIVRNVSPDGSAAEVTFDLTGRELGGWEIVVTNPDGSSASIDDGFTIEVGRAPRVWSYLAGPSVLRRDSERAFFVVYGNSGNVDMPAPVLNLSAPAGTKFRFSADDRQQLNALRIFATGASGSAATLKAGAGFVVRVLVQHAPDAVELELMVGNVEFAGRPFDWGRIAAAVPAGHDPAVWGLGVNRARLAMGTSWVEVMTNVRLVTGKANDPSTINNFDELLFYLVAVFAEQFEPFLASASAPSGPQPLTLDPVGTVNADPSHVYVLTHGAGGLTNPDGSVRRHDIVEMAERIKIRDPNANVYLSNWSAEAQKKVLGSLGRIPDAWEIAKGVDATGDLLALKMINAGIPPGRTTMISESAGGPVNVRASRKLEELGFGKVDKGLLLNPPNEAGGFGTPAKGAFNKSLALHTDSLYDSRKKLADFDVELETPAGAGDGDKHTGTWDLISGRLAEGDGSILNLDLPVVMGPAGNWDGKVNLDGSYQIIFNERPQQLVPEGFTPPDSPLGIITRLIVASLDPNDKAGPEGAGLQRYITGEIPFAYAIFFENQPEATAPAQEVVITDQLDPSKFDLSTFQLRLISFGNDVVLDPPPGLTEWTTDIDLPQRNLVVRLIAGLDQATGIITWHFFSLDPVTLQPTEDPLAGFLPPNVNPSEGDGAVVFTVRAHANQPTGTEIRNQARIFFDTNAPIDTPTWQNTIDNSPPTSAVHSLPAANGSSRFEVSWSGTDADAGIAGYTIYVSVDGGAYTVWLSNTTLTSAFYDGGPGRTYSFYSVAQDGAGNFEAPPGPADATTTTPAAGDLLNISTRMRVQTGEDVLIGGLIVAGTDPKKVIIRGIGPSLAQFLNGALENPTLELFQGSTLVASNDNWKESQQAEIEATGIPPSDDFESAIVQTLQPGSYTTVLRGKDGTTGIGLVEMYDLDMTANSKLANISTRGFVETGDDAMIGGCILGGSGSAGANSLVVVRAIGPSLSAFGIAGALQDPTLELKDANGSTLISNDDWQQSQANEIYATGLAPVDSRESALVTYLPDGNYTAVVRGKENTTGVGLVEVYNLQ